MQIEDEIVFCHKIIMKINITGGLENPFFLEFSGSVKNCKIDVDISAVLQTKMAPIAIFRVRF